MSFISNVTRPRGDVHQATIERLLFRDNNEAMAMNNCEWLQLSLFSRNTISLLDSMENNAVEYTKLLLDNKEVWVSTQVSQELITKTFTLFGVSFTYLHT